MGILFMLFSCANGNGKSPRQVSPGARHVDKNNPLEITEEERKKAGEASANAKKIYDDGFGERNGAD